MRIGGRLEQCIAQRAKEHCGCRRDESIASLPARTRRQQIEREKHQPEEETLVVGEYLKPRGTEHSGEWRTKQENVRGEMMRVKAEVVHARRITEQGIGGFEQVGEPATVLEVGVAREVRQHPSTVGRKEQCEHQQHEHHLRDPRQPRWFHASRLVMGARDSKRSSL
jgi:hypothetical protein